MRLSDFFQQYPRVAVAFSGGVDSAYLLYAAINCGAEVCAYYAKSPFQPEFELMDAQRQARELSVTLRVLPVDLLADTQVVCNDSRRCYFCKRLMFSKIQSSASADGYSVLLDGTNASDDVADRPGMQVNRELEVHSPLRECGLTKERIRLLSREAGLFTWNKPSYACLATRIPTGTAITPEELSRTETAENLLRSNGFRDFRIRLFHGGARLQVSCNDWTRLIAQRQLVLDLLKPLYPCVLLDLEVRDEE